MVFSWELFAELLDKGKAMQDGAIVGTQWKLSAGSFATVSWLSLYCCQMICAAQHSPGLTQVNCYMDH